MQDASKNHRRRQRGLAAAKQISADAVVIRILSEADGIIALKEDH